MDELLSDHVELLLHAVLGRFNIWRTKILQYGIELCPISFADSVTTTKIRPHGLYERVEASSLNTRIPNRTR